MNGNIFEYRDFTNTGDANHGTLVAGNASATTNNGIGISSIGFNCDLLLYNVSGSAAGSISWQYINAIDYAVQQGASVINCSFGSSGTNNDAMDAINNAIVAGVSVVGAAGAPNDNREFFPASYDDVICVSTVTINNYHAPTNDPHYPRVDICAPVSGYWRTAVGNTYTQPNCCTSNATPIVSGTVALMHSVNNGYTPRELRFFINQTGTTINDQANFQGLLGGGTVNAYKAVRRSASVHVQDIEMTGQQTITSNFDIHAGENVLPDNIGPVIIKQGANIVYDADEVYLEKGFEVEYGSTFEIR